MLIDKTIREERYQIILNAVDWLWEREDMINIRSRHLQGKHFGYCLLYA